MKDGLDELKRLAEIGEMVESYLDKYEILYLRKCYINNLLEGYRQDKYIKTEEL